MGDEKMEEELIELNEELIECIMYNNIEEWVEEKEEVDEWIVEDD